MASATTSEWPTAREAEASRLFSPIRIGTRCDLGSRTWIPALVPWRATKDGFVTPELLAWYARFAQGRPGALVVEATGIRDVSSGPLLRIGDDRFLPGLKKLVETVRATSGGTTRLLIQLIDFLSIRRRPDPQRYFREFLVLRSAHREKFPGASDGEIRGRLAAMPADELPTVLCAREIESLHFGERERITDVDRSHIRDLPDTLPPQFAAAADRARRAGFDGVELHYAHAYTMASFLSALNIREDGYGGTRKNRLRLPLEVLAAVRATVGNDFVVGCRMLSDEAISGGSSIDDACAFAVAFARAGADYLSLSKGGKFEDARQPRIGEPAYPYTGESGAECMPTIRKHASTTAGVYGRHLASAHQVRAAVRAAGFTTPIVATGAINTFRLAEDALARGDADICGAARQSLADPDWFTKMRSGRGDEIRRCTLTNYCEGLDQKHKKVTCQLWDKIDGERRLVAPPWG